MLPWPEEAPSESGKGEDEGGSWGGGGGAAWGYGGGGFAGEWY